MLPAIDTIEFFGYKSSPNLRMAKLNGNRVALDQSASYVPTKQSLKIRTPLLVDLNSGGPTWELAWEDGDEEL